MSLASGTDTTAELVTLYQAVAKLEVMLRPYNQGDAQVTKPGRFTEEQIATVRAQVARIAPAQDADKVRIAFLYVRGQAGVGEATRARAIVKLRATHWPLLNVPGDVARELEAHWATVS